MIEVRSRFRNVFQDIFSSELPQYDKSNNLEAVLSASTLWAASDFAPKGYRAYDVLRPPALASWLKQGFDFVANSSVALT